jgi:hypothetical protein
VTEKIDEDLWKQCRSVFPAGPVPREHFPYRCGQVDGKHVLIVDGDLVCMRHDMDFVLAGNGYRYDFIPKNELWLDGWVHYHEWPFDCYHEAHESRLMAKGMSYEKAHESANKVEKRLRERMLRGEK